MVDVDIGAGERIPTRIDGPARLKVTATLSQQTFAGWRPLTGAVRRSAALGGKTADSLTVVTAKVASFALHENLAEAAFAFALPQGMELEDRAAEPTKATAAPKGD